MRDVTDTEVWNHVSMTDSILISKDEDFVSMVLRGQTAGLVRVRIGNRRKDGSSSRIRKSYGQRGFRLYL